MAGEDATLSPGLLPASQSIPQLEERPKAIAARQETPELRVDPEFKGLIPPLTSSELRVLKESLLADGCRDKLIVWKDHNILLDGHHRHQICQEKGIRFETREIELSSRADAKIWILKNQRGRRNLNESQRAMLALKLEAIYSEQAKEKMGTRTGFVQNLGQVEGGRSAEKAAKDMNISHQTVTFAKKVATNGLPELIKMVESGDIAVSAAAQVASKPTDIQEAIVERVISQSRDGAKPKIAAIMREIAPSSQETQGDNPDMQLEKLRKNQKANLELLHGIESSLRPENLIEMLTATESIMARLREIEANSLDSGQIHSTNCVIELEDFKTFLLSLEPITKDLRIRFEADGVRAIASDMMGYMAADAFLPKELFSKYNELGEIGLPDTKKLLGMVSACSRDSSPGKKNLSLFVESCDEGDVSGKLHGASGRQESQYALLRPDLIIQRGMPEAHPSCEVIVEGKALAGAVKKAKDIDPIVKFLVSDGTLSLVSQNEDARGTQRPACRVLRSGSVDSKFNINRLMDISRIIEKSKEVTLGLGLGEPMTIDLKINTIAIKYYIKEETQ